MHSIYAQVKRSLICDLGEDQVANEDSFISEVTEEVRRDKLFKLMRRYGWIAIALVVLVVGGAAFVEWQKARARAAAEAVGDAVLAALSAENAEARVDALAALEPGEDADQRAVVLLLQAAAEAENDDAAAARATLDTVANSEASAIYRDMARLKSIMLADELSPEDRISALQPLIAAGNPFRLLALEQRAFAEIELGQKDTALETLQGIMADADRTEGLQRRASQLIVALGGVLDQG